MKDSRDGCQTNPLGTLSHQHRRQRAAQPADTPCAHTQSCRKVPPIFPRAFTYEIKLIAEILSVKNQQPNNLSHTLNPRPSRDPMPAHIQVTRPFAEPRLPRQWQWNTHQRRPRTTQWGLENPALVMTLGGQEHISSEVQAHWVPQRPGREREREKGFFLTLLTADTNLLKLF